MNNPERADLWTILEVPESLWDSMRDAKGLQGFVRDAYFEDKELSREDMDHPNIRDLLLFDKGYYWVFLNESYSPWPRLSDTIKEMETGVRTIIEEVESKIDMLVPQDRRPNFSSLDLNGLSGME